MELCETIQLARTVDRCGMVAVVTHRKQFDSYNFHFERKPLLPGTVIEYKYDPPAVVILNVC